MPTHPADPRPVDLITLKAAAALAGRSVDTIRRWRTEHGLRDYRDPTDLTASSAFSRAELLALLARLASTRAARAGSDVVDAVLEPPGPVSPMPTRPALSSSSSMPALLHVLVDDIRGALSRATDETGALRAEVARLGADLEAERKRRVDALEHARELAVRLARLEALVAHGKAKALEAERRRLQRRGVGDA